MEANNQKAIALDYEKIYSLNNNQKNLKKRSQTELNKNIRKKQDKRVHQLDKVNNPQVLLNTLKQNQLEFLLA